MKTNQIKVGSQVRVSANSRLYPGELATVAAVRRVIDGTSIPDDTYEVKVTIDRISAEVMTYDETPAFVFPISDLSPVSQ